MREGSRTEPWDTPTLREKGGRKEELEKIVKKITQKVVYKKSVEQSVSGSLYLVTRRIWPLGTTGFEE